MMDDYEVSKLMTRDEELSCFGPFDFSKYENVKKLSYVDLQKLGLMIQHRIEVLWEYTWVDGEVRPSTPEESDEWSRLNELTRQVNECIDEYKGVDSNDRKSIWELLDELV